MLTVLLLHALPRCLDYCNSDTYTEGMDAPNRPLLDGYSIDPPLNLEKAKSCCEPFDFRAIRSIVILPWGLHAKMTR